jgi:predicted SAM-dependent methyltransferase
MWFKRKGFKYITADLFDKTADLRIDIQNTHLKSDTYDFIACNHVLEHVPDFKKALKELCRILKPDGILEITVPLDCHLDATYENFSIINPEERKKYFGQIDHCRIFGIDFNQYLLECGFNIKIINGDDCDLKIRPINGPSYYDYNKVFICTKK